MRTRILAGMAALVMAPAPALAQWSEDFESYGDGQLLYHVGGWSGFFDEMNVAGRATSAQARSGNRSIFVGPGTDAVHPFIPNYTSGQWTLSAWMYMAREDHVEDTYFIVHNEFEFPGPFRWTIEMQFDYSTGTVLDDFRPDTPIPIAYDRWAPIRIDFDLDNDAQTTWYDGQFLSTGTVRLDPSFPLAVANVNLFSAGATSYYDDFRIIPAPGGAAVLSLGALALAGRRRRHRRA